MGEGDRGKRSEREREGEGEGGWGGRAEWGERGKKRGCREGSGLWRAVLSHRQHHIVTSRMLYL